MLEKIIPPSLKAISILNFRLIRVKLSGKIKSLVNGNIYFSILGGARFLKNPMEFLKIQKELNPFPVRGFDPDVEVLGPDIFLEFANANNMDLLLGIDQNLLYDELAKIFERINSYINSGLKTKKRFTLYFNDVPQDIKPEKFSKIIKYIKNIRSDLS